MKTVIEVSKLTGYEASHLRRLIRAGKLQARIDPIPGRERRKTCFRYLIYESEIQRLLNKPRDGRGRPSNS